MSDVIFELRDVDYEYPTGQKALTGINLDVRKGERLAALGANASGKSTLLHILDGLYFASSGVVKAYGKSLNEDALQDAEFRRFFRSEVGILFQNVDAQLFCATVEEDIAFGPLQLGLSGEEVRNRIRDTAMLCGVEHLLARPSHALSGGEKKRVALASALAMNPSVLLLDEPTSGLDPRTELWLMETLQELSSAGKTIVVSTHDLRFASEFAGRVIALAENHTLAAEGTPEQILGNHDLLLSLNLIHSHDHRHDGMLHSHPHVHSLGHEHGHKPEF